MSCNFCKLGTADMTWKWFCMLDILFCVNEKVLSVCVMWYLYAYTCTYCVVCIATCMWDRKYERERERGVCSYFMFHDASSLLCVYVCVCVISIYTYTYYLLCRFLAVCVWERKRERERERERYAWSLLDLSWWVISLLFCACMCVSVYDPYIHIFTYAWYDVVCMATCVCERERKRKRGVYDQYLMCHVWSSLLRVCVWYLYVHVHVTCCDVCIESVWEKARERERGMYMVNTWFIVIGLLSLLCTYVCVCDVHIYKYMLIAVSLCLYCSMCVRESERRERERERERWVHCQYLIFCDWSSLLFCACMCVYGDIYIYIYMLRAVSFRLYFTCVCVREMCVWLYLICHDWFSLTRLWVCVWCDISSLLFYVCVCLVFVFYSVRSILLFIVCLAGRFCFFLLCACYIREIVYVCVW